MRKEEYEIMYHVEDHHWWYLGMKRITCELLDETFGKNPHLNILDAGCGTGAGMEYLAKYGTVTGVDLSTEALRFCQKRNRGRLVRASVIDLPYPDNTFDLITSFDVLCEQDVPNDEQVLREFMRVLKPEGWILLRLPAYAWMRGKHDEAVYIAHRYTVHELKQKLQRAGFGDGQFSYANTFLFPIAAMKRFSERFIPIGQKGSDLTLDAGLMNGIFKTILSAEAPLVSSTGLPFGLTAVAMARKSSERDVFRNVQIHTSVV